MTSPDAVAAEVTAWARKQLLDQAAAWCDRFVLAMRDEGITDEVTARVVNRVLIGQPDPDEVITVDRRQDMISRAGRRSNTITFSGRIGGPTCP